MSLRAGFRKRRVRFSGFSTGSAPVLDPQTVIYQAALATGSATALTAPQLTAMDAFFKGLRTDALLGTSTANSKILRQNVYGVSSFGAIQVPTISFAGGATDTNNNFVAGDWSATTGLTGNGTSKYIDTALVPVTSLTLNDTHLGIYIRDSLSGVATNLMGADDTGTFRMYAPFTDGNFYSDEYDGAAGRLGPVAGLTTPYAMTLATRVSAVLHSLYQRGVSKGSNTGSGGTLPTSKVFIFAESASNVAGSWSNHTLSLYTIGKGLTATDALNYYNRVQTLMTALGLSV